MPDELGRLALQATEAPLLLIRSDRALHFSTDAAALIFGEAAIPGQSLSAFGRKDPTLPEVVERVLTSGEAATGEVMLSSGTVYTRRVVPYASNGTAMAIVAYIGSSAYARASDNRHNQLRQASLIEQEYLAATRRAALEDIHLRATVASGIVNTIYKEQVQTIRLAKRLLHDGSGRDQRKSMADVLTAAADGIESKLQALSTIFDRGQGLAAPEHGTAAIQRIIDRVAAALPASVKIEDKLHIVSSSALVQTDPRLLTQALYALLTCCIEKDDDRLVLGCRRRAHELQLQFRCRPNMDAMPTHNGDSIWNPFAEEALRRLGHRLDRIPNNEKVGGFDIFLPLAPAGMPADHPRVSIPPFVGARGAALVVSGDTDQRKLLSELLRQRGFDPMSASDGHQAVKLSVESRQKPSLLVGDLDLPGHLDGSDVVALIRETLQIEMPAILLRSGFESTAGLPGSALRRCALLWKPVHPEMLEQRIEELVKTDPWSETRSPATPSPRGSDAGIAILDAATPARAQLQAFLTHRGYCVSAYNSVAHFTARQEAEGIGCVLLDTGLLGAETEPFIDSLRDQAGAPRVIVLSNANRIEQAVAFMRAGAADFLVKPADPEALCASIDRALSFVLHPNFKRAGQITAGQRMLSLTGRERDILARILEGGRNKTIAYELDVSQRTVEYHRATIMKKMGADHVTDLVRICAEAAEGGYPPPKALA